MRRKRLGFSRTARKRSSLPGISTRPAGFGPEKIEDLVLLHAEAMMARGQNDPALKFLQKEYPRSRPRPEKARASVSSSPGSSRRRARPRRPSPSTRNSGRRIRTPGSMRTNWRGCTRRLKQDQQARAVYESVLASEPHDMKAVSGLVDILIRTKDLTAPTPSWTAPPARPVRAGLGRGPGLLSARGPAGRGRHACEILRRAQPVQPRGPGRARGTPVEAGRPERGAVGVRRGAERWRRISRSPSGAPIWTSRRTAHRTPWRSSEKSSKKRGRTRCRRFWPSRCRPTARSRKPATS